MVICGHKVDRKKTFCELTELRNDLNHDFPNQEHLKFVYFLLSKKKDFTSHLILQRIDFDPSNLVLCEGALLHDPATGDVIEACVNTLDYLLPLESGEAHVSHHLGSVVLV